MNNVKSHLFRYNNICIDFAMNDDAREFCDKEALSSQLHMYIQYTYIYFIVCACMYMYTYIFVCSYFFLFYSLFICDNSRTINVK